MKCGFRIGLIIISLLFLILMVLSGTTTQSLLSDSKGDFTGVFRPSIGNWYIINQVPTAKFTANTTQGQAPLAVQFTDQSVITGITSYTWDINNDGVTEYTTKNPVHTYPTAGTYTVKHSVTNTSGSDSEIKTNYIQVSTLQSAECYGAEACNPTGNPIGGGAGYTNLISQTNPNVKYVVSTKDQLLTALKSAKSGEIIFVPETANIDMTGVYGTHIPAGVTLASNRGSNGSVGGRIFTGAGQPAGWGASISMLEINGNNVRITGLRLEGNEKSKVFTGYEGTFGVFSYGFTGVEIDNNEIWGFGQADVTVGMPNDAGSNTTQQAALAATEIGSTIMNVHHNYLHHSQIEAEGYGVNVVRGSALIKANLFDYTRHAIADDGFDWNGYEATYNVYIGSNAYSHIFDVHGQNGGMGGKAGNTYRIVHNTFLSNTSHAIFIRGVPLNNALITLNIMNNCYETTGDLCWGDPPNAVQQYNSVGNITMMNNIIDGKYVSGSQILNEIP